MNHTIVSLNLIRFLSLEKEENRYELLVSAGGHAGPLLQFGHTSGFRWPNPARVPLCACGDVPGSVSERSPRWSAEPRGGGASHADRAASPAAGGRDSQGGASPQDCPGGKRRQWIAGLSGEERRGTRACTGRGFAASAGSGGGACAGQGGIELAAPSEDLRHDRVEHILEQRRGELARRSEHRGAFTRRAGPERFVQLHDAPEPLRGDH